MRDLLLVFIFILVIIIIILILWWLSKQQNQTLPTDNPNDPVDCVAGEWGEWTECSKNCGGGTKTRSREITQRAMHGGNDCTGTVENSACNEQACPLNWSEYPGTIPQDVTGLPRPDGTEGTGWLFKANLAECKAHCLATGGCNVISWTTSDDRLNYEPGCMLKRANSSSINLSPAIANYRANCLDSVTCIPPVVS